MRKHFPPILVLLFLTFIVHWKWFFTLDLLTHGDFLVDYIERAREFFAFPSAWESTRIFGFSNIGMTFWPFTAIGGLLSVTNFSPMLTERIILLWPIGIFSVISMYPLAYNLFKSRISAFTSSIVYGFNVAFLIGQTGNITASAAISFAPLLIFFFIVAVEKRNYLYYFITLFLAFVVGIFEFRFLYLTVWIIFFYTIFYFSVIDKSNFFKNRLLKKAIYLLSFIIIFLLLNAYWILGLISSNSIITNEVFSRGLTGEGFVDIAKTLSFFLYLWTGGSFTAFVVYPIPYYFWFIPIFSFLGLLYAKKNPRIIFFAFIGLLGVFLAKHVNPPFPNVYSWLFDNLPGFNAFRESTKFYFYIGISYSILIGAFLSFLFESFKTRIGRILTWIIFILIFAIFIWNTKPFITGEVGAIFASRTIPKEYIDFKNYIFDQKNFYRTIVVPVWQRYLAYSINHPTMGFFNLSDNLQSLNPKLLSLEGIKYVILPYDSENDIYHDWGPRESFEKFIGLSNLSFFKNFGKIKVWENKNIQPRIMPAEELIYVNGIDNLIDIIDLQESDRSTFALEEILPADKKQRKIYSERNANKLSYATQIYSVAECVRCDTSKKYFDYIKFPFAKILPDSPLYAYIRWKEQKLTNSLKSPEEKLNQEVYFSIKRTLEIQSMLSKGSHTRYVINTISENYKRLDEIRHDYLTGSKSNSSLLNTFDYLSLEKKILEDFIAQNESNDMRKIDVPGDVGKVIEQTLYKLSVMIDDLSKKIWITTENSKKYFLSLPEDGNYNIFVNKQQDIYENETKLFLDNKELKPIKVDRSYISFGGAEMKKGKYSLEYRIKSKELLSTDKNFFSMHAKNLSDSRQIPISNLSDPKSKYHLSFKYRILSGKSPRLYISDDASLIDSYTNTGIVNYSIDRTISNFNDNRWHNFDFYFSPHYSVTKSYLNFFLPNGDDSEIEIQEISLTRIIKPTIVFVKDRNKVLSTPKIDFIEINPTFYRVRIREAISPFSLTFSEGFDENWKLYPTGNKTQQFENKKIAANFFGGKVNELEYDYSLGLSSILALIRNDSLPETFHFKANTFSNSYLIDKKGNFTLDLVYRPQIFTIIGFVISISTFVFVCLTIGYLFLKRKYKQ